MDPAAGWIRLGALWPLPWPCGEHVAVAGAVVDPPRRRRHAGALHAALPAVLHTRRPLPLPLAAPHRALARAEPCLHIRRARDQPPAVYLAAGSTYDASLLT